MPEEPVQNERTIIAEYDDVGLFVYQAFRPAIVEEALRLGTFGKGFNLDRITWIKPSFGWMLHRSDYATAHRQERILKIKLPHDVFLAILRQGVSTSYEPTIHQTEAEWRSALSKTDVMYQWDPDRDWKHRKLSRRAIQIGLQGEIVKQYVGWIIGVQDATPLAHQCQRDAEKGSKSPAQYPDERVYYVPEDIQRIMGMSA
jgi:hypothetical protein